MNIGSRGEGGISREGLGDVVIGSVHIMVFLVCGVWSATDSLIHNEEHIGAYAGQDAVEPVQNMLLNRHRDEVWRMEKRG